MTIENANLTVSILNPTKGEIDSVRMKIGDVISRSCRSTNPSLRNTEPQKCRSGTPAAPARMIIYCWRMRPRNISVCSS